MQRAAASAAANEPQSTAETPSPKRQRGTSPTTPQSDLEAISAALAAEEDRRREAVNRQAAEAGETEWVLDFETAPTPQPRVVLADSLDAEDEVYGGRQSYGNFKRKKKTVVCPALSLLSYMSGVD